MAYTIQDVVTSARSILQDKVEPYRYSDPELTEAANFALFNVQKLRPDLFFGSYPIAASSYTLSDALPIPDIYAPAITAYVSGWAELRDDEYTEDSRAALLLAALKPSLQDG